MPKTSISIPAVEIGTLRVTIIGDTPLIIHRFSDEALILNG